MRNIKLMGVFLFYLVSTQFVKAKIWTPAIISDNMVLQQNKDVKIWGWTTMAAETITLVGSWNNKEVKVDAIKGFWSINIKTPNTEGPFTLTISGHETIVIKNILMGEVWLCSGQSNMQWGPTNGLKNAEEEIKNAKYPKLRFFQVARQIANSPQDNLVGEWVECTPDSFKNFSSVAYFFGRKLHKDASFPVGLINSSWGGTPVETWIEEASMKSDPFLLSEAAKINENKWRPHKIGKAYNAMIAPITNFNIAGCIWYQGESNRVNANSYYTSFPLLINSWRKSWQKEFPFYFVQIAPFNYKDGLNINGATVRDAQLKTLTTVAKTGMAVTNDIGNLKNIHPINKQEVGRRLALWALNKQYGQKDITYSGPLYKSMSIDRNKAILEFNHANNGLKITGKKLTNFVIAGVDKVFYPAKANIKGNKVVVWSSKVKSPVAVRFAFDDIAEPNLINIEGLPASAFRTDNWEIVLKN